MLLRICGFGLMALVMAVGSSAGQEKKATPKATGKDAKEVVGNVKEVDLKKKSFSITLADKTDRTFLVNKDTKFLGPRGAEHEEGLKDDAMAKGTEIRVVPAADEKYAKEVKLPAVKAPGKKKG